MKQQTNPPIGGAARNAMPFASIDDICHRAIEVSSFTKQTRALEFLFPKVFAFRKSVGRLLRNRDTNLTEYPYNVLRFAADRREQTDAFSLTM